MSELRPCPWCKGTPEVLDRDWGDMTEYRVECLVVDCPVNPSTRHFATEAEAIDAWNTRADDDADLIPEVVRRLEEFERTGGETVSLEEIMAEDGWVRERTCQREKHGVKMDGSPRLRCSLCGYGIGDKRWKYCPCCGARIEVAE